MKKKVELDEEMLSHRMKELESILIHQCTHTSIPIHLQLQALMNAYLVINKKLDKEIKEMLNN